MHAVSFNLCSMLSLFREFVLGQSWFQNRNAAYQQLSGSSHVMYIATALQAKLQYGSVAFLLIRKPQFPSM